jgi:ABC-type transport system involved in multi-copper enzyme maturation permease subunit
MRDFAERFKLDRTIALVMLASVVVYAMVAAQELGGDSWGMVLSLAPYQAIIAAVLTAATIAREFEAGTVAFGLTQSMSRHGWLWWRIMFPLLLVAVGGIGLGAVVGFVHHQTPADMLVYLSPAAQAASHWQVPLADAVLSVAVGLLVAIVVRRVVAAVSVSALIVIAFTYVASLARDTFTIAAPGSAAGGWVILAEELLVAAALFGAAVSALRRSDV